MNKMNLRKRRKTNYKSLVIYYDEKTGVIRMMDNEEEVSGDACVSPIFVQGIEMNQNTKKNSEAKKVSLCL